ncbi:MULTISPECIES: PaaI family thioesterase [Actinomadura]|uniref:Hotdog fold thioesterase n=1 Tax=Actinomadura miaoliensis TaxID=430685 RepID=A0ABP7W9J7_9ACTN
MTDDQQELVELLNGVAQGHLPRAMGVEILEATAERVVGRMPVKGNTQPYGLLHGGASCVLAESLGSTGAALHAGRDRVAVGIEINATHHRSATDGYVTGVATKLHAGRSLATYDIVITDEDGRRVCTARLTCMLRDRPPADGANPVPQLPTG